MADIQLTAVSKVFGAGAQACRAVDSVDLRIAEGEFFFLLGPSGCGKTTLLRMLAGLVDPTEGCIRFAGKDVTNVPVHKRDTAMVFQNYALWPHMTVQENVEFGPRMRKVSKDERRRRVRERLAMVKIEHLSQRKPRQLSGGQQQRVAVARALAAEPACLLLDEPLSNLDAQLRLEMRGQLRDIVKSSGATAVYVTHDQKEALAMADRMAVMKDGKIAQLGTPVELYDRPASRFVAEFIGEANFISGRLAAAEDGGAVETAAGMISVSSVGPDVAKPGAPVTCCVRPERIILRPKGEGGLPGIVTQRIYQGETVQYRVTLTSRDDWKVLAFGGGRLYDNGDEVTLQLPPESVVLLKE
ncbi:MAG: ABC transporter ATP-binding protein [Lentisphaeria bacterium]|nr:ABC transporter ATP-binding protein [Lentisphaeria bacterium]